MAPRSRRILHDISNSAVPPSDDGTLTHSSSDPDTSADDETYGTKTYRKAAVTLLAFVVDADDLEDDGGPDRASVPDNADGVQGKIRKMLELGLHPDTPDFEAQQALQNAQRLLTKHNLKQADVMRGEKVAAAFQGGIRMVELRSNGNKKEAIGGGFADWVYSLASTVASYFDTEYFTQKRYAARQIVFYGIKQNVNCAAYAFAATFNRISKLSADFVPFKSTAFSSQSVHSRVSRMSYRKGLVKGLYESVKASRRREGGGGGGDKGEGRGKENVEGLIEGRRNGGDGEMGWGSDECGGEEGGMCMSGMKGDGEEDGEEEEGREGAMAALVLHSRRVAEEVLRQKKIEVKVRKRRKGGACVWDEAAFQRGKKDSKALDLGQKALGSSSSRSSSARPKPTKRPRRRQCPSS